MSSYVAAIFTCRNGNRRQTLFESTLSVYWLHFAVKCVIYEQRAFQQHGCFSPGPAVFVMPGFPWPFKAINDTGGSQALSWATCFFFTAIGHMVRSPVLEGGGWGGGGRLLALRRGDRKKGEGRRRCGRWRPRVAPAGSRWRPAGLCSSKELPSGVCKRQPRLSAGCILWWAESFHIIPLHLASNCQH